MVATEEIACDDCLTRGRRLNFAMYPNSYSEFLQDWSEDYPGSKHPSVRYCSALPLCLFNGVCVVLSRRWRGGKRALVGIVIVLRDSADKADITRSVLSSTPSSF